jgi:hypothetical protein
MGGLMVLPTEEGDVLRRVVEPIRVAMMPVDGAATAGLLATDLARLGWIEGCGDGPTTLVRVALIAAPPMLGIGHGLIPH